MLVRLNRDIRRGLWLHEDFDFQIPSFMYLSHPHTLCIMYDCEESNANHITRNSKTIMNGKRQVR